MKILVGILCGALLFTVGVREARADAFAINFSGSTLSGDTNSGVTTWTSSAVAGGADQLFQEQYYVSINGGAINLILPEFFRQNTLNSISVFYNIDAAGTCSLAVQTGCDIVINHVLGTSTWSTSLSVLHSLGNSWSLFNYADYDLSATIADDTADYLGGGLFVQSDFLTLLRWQYSLNPSDWDVRNFPDLAGGNLGNLLNNNHCVGDCTFATRQDGNVTGYSIDRGLFPVPEPASMLLLGTGLAGIARAVRRRAKKQA